MTESHCTLLDVNAAYFGSHSNLTLNASKLVDVLQLLVNGHNAHEAKIAELETRIQSLQEGHETVRVSPAVALAPPRVTITEPEASLSPSVQPTDAVVISRQQTSPRRGEQPVATVPARSASPAAATKPTGGKAATSHQQDLEKVKHSVSQLHQVLGLHTDEGQQTFQKFQAGGTVSSGGLASYKPLLSLPPFALLAQQFDDARSEAVQFRGFEARLDMLTTVVESIQQQIAQGVGTPASSRKANTSQRSPLISSLALVSSSQAASTNGNASVDAAARVDIARLAKDLKSVQQQMTAWKVAATNHESQQTRRKHRQSDDESTDDDSPSSDVARTARVDAILKRVEVLERNSKLRTSVNLAGPSTPGDTALGSPCSHSPTARSSRPLSPNGDVRSAKGSASGAGQVTSPPPPPAFDPSAAIHAVEEKAMIENRKLRDALTANFGSQLDALRRDVTRVDGWILAHEAMHDELVPSIISQASFVVGRGGDAAGNESTQLTPRRPASAVITNVQSPYVPKRDAIQKAGALNPRSTAPGRTVVDPYNVTVAQRPQSAGGNNNNNNAKQQSVVYRLFQQPPVGFHGSLPFSLPTSQDLQRRRVSGASSPSVQPAAAASVAHHPSESCVVWDCGWCAASRDREPQWSSSPPPAAAHR